MTRAFFHFDPELHLFLRREHRGRSFEHVSPPTDTLMHVLESLGVPHTEIGAVTVNGGPAALHAPPPSGARVQVMARGAERLEDPRFVLDAHLGRLAAYLRMLGFDTLHDRLAHDADVAAASVRDGRVLLTRDVGLLKRGDVVRGAFIRATDPAQQLEEAVARFGLLASAAPFTRCLRCNARLEAVAKTSVSDRLPSRVREHYEDFGRCPACGRVYWKGTHFSRMVERIRSLHTLTSRDSRSGAL